MVTRLYCTMTSKVYLCTGDTGLRGPVRETGVSGMKGAKGDEGIH